MRLGTPAPAPPFPFPFAPAPSPGLPSTPTAVVLPNDALCFPGESPTPPTASLFGDPVGVKNNEEDDVDGDVGCGVLGGANAETDRGDDGTTENAGESVPGDNVCMSNAVRAEANERVLFFVAGSWDLPFGVAVVVVVIGSTADCVIVRGGEGG